jgi:signal transduction histidine kinase/CheY-like chemotaxis protein
MSGCSRVAFFEAAILNAPLRIMRIRRTYNQWVANQTLEDYALRFTAKSARRWSTARVANTAFGAISFLALEAIGGSLMVGYGFANTVTAVAVVTLVIFLTAMPITFYAARYGVDIDLLTRGAGFGYIGSTITSLIYASFTFIFFAIEAAIMALALEMSFGLPLALGYVLCSVIVIPIVTHGITLISKFQVWTQPLWLVLQLVPVLLLAWGNPDGLSDWTTYKGGSGDGSFDILLFGAAATVVFSLVAQIGEQVDFLRFMPEPTPQSKTRWRLALLAAGPGWIVAGAIKILIGSFLAFMAIQTMVPAHRAAEPTQMYLNAFQHLVGSPKAALLLTALFVIIAQLKINVTNAYAGSIAWSNFFSRLTHSHPGRVVWVVFNVVIAVILMELGIYRSLERILGVYSLLAVAWVGAIVADLIINKPLGLSPPGIEFKRAHLYDINPVGTGSMSIAAVLALAAYFGVFGSTAAALAPFIALLSAMSFAPLIAWLTGGRYYIARPAATGLKAGGAGTCIICEYVFEAEDMSHCPVYSGAICSLCCSLDARCHDRCKPNARTWSRLPASIGNILPVGLVQPFHSRFGHYLGIMLLFNIIIALILGLIYFQVTLDPAVPADAIGATLLKVFAILLIIVGVAAWLLVLAQESRKVAQEESDRQTHLLLQEIEAHKETDRQLQKAKEAAERANSAKSRYLGSISHELRTPLNAILGYAQLLGRDTRLHQKAHAAVRVVQRSSEHLSSLIDGLLDIARIEAGKFRLEKEPVRLPELLDQIVDMFRLQASGKELRFIYDPGAVPEWVHTDGKQLRQILINLLSNAIKFTHHGHVALRVRGRGETVQFEVEDTGIGIAPDDLERIFQPFERASASPSFGGVGLGLTITKLMVKVMGGDLAVESSPDGGTTFRVLLHLPRIEDRNNGARSRSTRPIEGHGRKILIVDDESAHRAFLNEALAGLGFVVAEAENALGGVAQAQRMRPDIVLMDIAMPGRDGWEAARMLKAWNPDLPVVIVSANPPDASDEQRRLCRDYVLKPVDLERLLPIIARYLPPAEGEATADSADAGAALPQTVREEILGLARIGYISGLIDRLEALMQDLPHHASLFRQLHRHATAFQLRAIIDRLGSNPHG